MNLLHKPLKLKDKSDKEFGKGNFKWEKMSLGKHVDLASKDGSVRAMQKYVAKRVTVNYAKDCGVLSYLRGKKTEKFHQRVTQKKNTLE